MEMWRGEKATAEKHIMVLEKKILESSPSRQLAERSIGAVTEEHNSSLSLVLFRRTGSYILFQMRRFAS